ncbi:MAG: DUF2157 domain-containing protein [Treponema sp.]|nr:DUF2157 domain-containing protein [Treponema sp.]
MSEKFINWFLKEIPSLTEKGIITAQVAHSLNEYYINKLAELEKPVEIKPETAQAQESDPVYTELTVTPSNIQKTEKPEVPQTAPQVKPAAKKAPKVSVSVILTVIASVLISFGIISLVAYNWAAIPRLAKAITAIVLLLATQTAGFILIKTGKAEQVKIREGYSIFWALLFGAMVAFVSQIFKFPGDSASFMFVWTLSAIIITILFSAHTSFYLSMLFTLIFAFISWESKSAILLYLLCAGLYLPARKSKAREIPLFILSYLFFIFRINEMPVGQNIKAMLFVFSLVSIGFTLLKNQNKELPIYYCGIIIIALSALISLFAENYYSNLEIQKSPIKIIELAIILIITAGLYTEGAVIPLVKKIRNKEKLSFENLLYLIPILLALNTLLPEQTEVLQTAALSEWYKVFLSPFTLLILYSMTMFVIGAQKNHKLAWAFLAFIILQAFRINEVSVSLFYTFVSLSFFIPSVILWKNKFSSTNENIATITTSRVISALLFFIPAFLSICNTEYFYSISKVPGIGFLCFIPAAIFGLLLLIQHTKKDSKVFLKNLDIFLNLIFAFISMAAASSQNKGTIDFAIKIFVALNFIYYTAVAIKKEKYIFLLNTVLSMAYFIITLMSPESGTTVMYLLCTGILFAAGCFLWKNNFGLTPEIKNCLIVVRVAAVIILFITILLARKADSLLYVNKGIAPYILCTFTPLAAFGLFMSCIFAKKHIKDFLLNIDIIINIVVTAIILALSYLCNENIILLILEILIAINLITSCIYIIRSGRYEYAFYVLFALIYFVISFISHEFSISILYLISTIILFTSGTYLWREKFELNENSKLILIITRFVAAAFLLAITILSREPYSILYDNNGIEKYILICFTPAALFGLTLYIVLAKKNLSLFLKNADIAINLFFASLIFATAYLCEAKAIQVLSEIIMILNLLVACIYILLHKKNEYVFYPAISLIYFFVVFSSIKNANTIAGVFFIIAILAVIIHYFAQTKNSSPAKILSAITTGFVLFYETSIRYLIEDEHFHLACNFYIISCMLIMGAVALFYLIQMIQNKVFFNPAIFLTPVLVIVLTFISDKFSVLITFPLILLFCVYYFYLAYKNNSLKTANLSTIYFGLMLMIRFFSSGYGLSVQGITLISMGVLILVMNILMTKRREKND